MQLAIRKLTFFATAVILTMSSVFAQNPPTLPAVHQNAGVEYMSGGIGVDESTAIKSISRKWPLTLVFSVKSSTRAQYAADVNVSIKDVKGHVVLQVQSQGPYLLVKLPAGRYLVDAIYAGHSMTKKFVVAETKPIHIDVVWPAGTGV